MSRIGKKIIEVPSGVDVTISGKLVSVKGPKGTLSEKLHPHATVEMTDEGLTVSVNDPELVDDKAIWGLTRSLVANMVIGVTEGFTKSLEINGIGYKVQMKGKDLELNVGYSHPVVYNAPEGIVLSTEKNVITVTGISKHLVGQTAAEIRGIKKPEPYKGKGIKYADEVVRRKAGKVVKAGG